MANKFPLILNTSANQIQEIASGDNLDLTGCGINNAGVITATSFSGNITGGVTGNADTATEATNVTVTANNSTNETVYPIFVDGATGTQGAESDTGLTYNPSSGNLTSTQFTGTLQTAAQPNITSVGTLSALNVSGNVSIGGTLTYEDVTNIDSVGIITARTGVVSPYADIDDWIDVGNNIQLGNAGVITATTFRGDGDFVELDVDGHTNLDNVSIAGVTTATGGIALGGGNITLLDRPDGNSHNLFFGTGGKAAAYHDGTNFTLINNTGHTYIGIGAANKNLMLYAQSTGNIILQRNTGHKYFEGVGSDGTAIIYHNTNEKIRSTNTGAVITGICTATTFQGEAVKPVANSGTVKLYHNTAIKLETSSSGVNFGTGASDILLISGQTLYRNGSNGSGVHFTTGAIYPTNNSGANNNGATNLGGTSNKFGTLFSTLVKSDRVDCDGLLHVQYGNATNTNYMSSLSNSNGIMHLFRGDGLYIGNNMNTSNQASGPNNKAITLGTNGNITATGNGSQLGYVQLGVGTYKNIIQAVTDTNLNINAPNGVWAQTNGTTRWGVAVADGNAILPYADNTYNIGSDAKRVKTVTANLFSTHQQGSPVTYFPSENSIIYYDSQTAIVLDNNGSYHTMKQWRVTKEGSVTIKFTARNQAGAYYWSYIVTTSNGTRVNPNGSGNDSNNCRWSDHLDTGNSQAVHQFRTFKIDVGNVSPGDVISLKMANTASSGALVTGSQYLYAKDFRVYSSTPTVDGSSSTDSLSQSNWSRNVAYFWADRSGNVNFDSSAFGASVVFNRIVESNGITTGGDSNHNFDTSTGRFYAPCKGIYLFNTSIYTTASLEFNQAWYTKNGSRCPGTDYVAPNTTSNMQFIQWNSIIKLEAGDAVGTHPHTGGTFAVAENNWHTYFKGTLLNGIGI